MLAGGAGSRLGGAKPSALLAGLPLIAYPIAAAVAGGLDVVVVAKRDTPLPPLQCPLVVEPERPLHPLCGVVAALDCAEQRAVVVVACDMPFLTGPLLDWLAGLSGSAVATVDRRVQPLLARYVQANRPVFERALGEERSLTSAVGEIAATQIDAPALARFGDPTRLCFSVNDAGDLALAEQWLAD